MASNANSPARVAVMQAALDSLDHAGRDMERAHVHAALDHVPFDHAVTKIYKVRRVELLEGKLSQRD